MGILAAFVLVAIVFALDLRSDKLPRRGYRTFPFGHGPFPLAFSYTTLGLFALIGGLAGFAFRKSDLIIGGTLTGAIVWPEVGFGLVMLVIAAYFWRTALQAMS